MDKTTPSAKRLQDGQFKTLACVPSSKTAVPVLILLAVCGLYTSSYIKGFTWLPSQYIRMTYPPVKVVPLDYHQWTLAHNINTYLPLLVFNEESLALPYYFQPVTVHKNDKFRTQTTYDLVNTSSLIHSRQSNESKLIVFYNRPDWFSVDSAEKSLKECRQQGCSFSSDRNLHPKAEAVIIDGVDLNIKTPPTKYANQVWLLFGLESPHHYHTPVHRSESWKRVFNWTMTYRLDSDVVVPYSIILRKKEKPKLDFNAIAGNKTKSVMWLVSNCGTPSRRMKYVEELKKFLTVDVYGNCGPNKCNGNCNDLQERDYRFYLSFENSLCDDYITEKLFRPYTINIIPVVRGGADYASALPKGTYINTADFSSPKELAQYLKYLEQNVTAYTEILTRKSEYTSTPFSTLGSAVCDICVKLHNLDKFFNFYEDHVQWLHKDTCRTPTDT